MKNKTKKNRKGCRESSPKLNFKKMELPRLNIQFNITLDNLSCFMSSRSHMKKERRKASRSTCKVRKVDLKPKLKQCGKDLGEVRKTEMSPDISRQLSNSILSQIEKKGVKCTWKEVQEKQGRDFSNQGDNDHLFTAFSNDFEKSYASTSDFPFHQPISYCQYEQSKTLKSKSVYDSTVFTVLTENIGNDPRTTIMIRNIPNKYTIDDLSRQIDSEHANIYDFLYLPCDLKNQCNVGYGFINFTNTEFLKSFYEKFHQYNWKKFKSEKICALTYARLQGLTQLIQHFENSKVIKDKKYRPIIKYDKIQEIVLSQQRRQAV